MSGLILLAWVFGPATLFVLRAYRRGWRPCQPQAPVMGGEGDDAES